MASDTKREDLAGDVAKYIQSNCSRLPMANMRWNGCALPSNYEKYAKDIENFEVRSDDVWVLSYPKCGTTWTQEMVWLLVNGCDFEMAKKVKLTERFPFLEFVAIGGSSDNNTIDKAKGMPSPRLIKCHLPAHLLPKQIWTKKPKMIYVYRDPRDVVISYFHHMQLWYNFTGTIERFIDAFLEEILPYDPYWEHVLKFWQLRDEPNFCFNTFEEMKADLGKIIDKTSAFLEISISAEKRTGLLNHLSFSSMQNNDSVNYKADINVDCKFKNVQFIREGKAGAWKNKLSPQQVNRFNCLADKYLSGIDFPYYLR